MKVEFVVINRPKIGTDGRTDVVLERDNERTPMGYILKARGQDAFRAHTLEDILIGEFTTRSQAGHQIQRTFEGRQAKRTLPHAIAAAVEVDSDA